MSDLAFLKLKLYNCDGFIDNTENWEEELTEHGTLLVLYPKDSDSHLQIHFLVNGTVEIHRGENHEVFKTYTTEQFLLIWDTMSENRWLSPLTERDKRRLVTNWLMLTKLTNQT